MKSKILIFGSKGLLGGELKAQNNNNKFKSLFLSKNSVDITNYKLVKKSIEKFKPNFIINCAALTDVDLCEKNKKLAYQINSLGPENIVKNIKNKDIVLIHISTDYVFNKKKKTLINENSITKPISTYGKSKLRAEKAIITSLEKYIIIRTSWLYGKKKNNFLQKIYNLSLKNNELSIIFDQFSLPTYVNNLATTIYKIISVLEKNNNKYYGIYHYCDSGIPISRYEFSKYFFKYIKKSKFLKINKISYNKFYEKNIRPINSGMSSRKISKIFNIKALNWKKSLLKFIKKEFV